MPHLIQITIIWPLNKVFENLSLDTCIHNKRNLFIPFLFMRQVPSATALTVVCSDRNMVDVPELLSVELDEVHGFLLGLEQHLRPQGYWAIDAVSWFTHSSISFLIPQSRSACCISWM